MSGPLATPVGRWSTVLGVSHLIAAAQAGPIRSTGGGGANPVGQVPCQRAPAGVGGSFSGRCVPRAYGACPCRRPLSLPLLGGVAVLWRSAMLPALLGTPRPRHVLLFGYKWRSK